MWALQYLYFLLARLLQELNIIGFKMRVMLWLILAVFGALSSSIIILFSKRSVAQVDEYVVAFFQSFTPILCYKIHESRRISEDLTNHKVSARNLKPY